MRRSLLSIAFLCSVSSAAFAQQCGGDFTSWKAELTQEAQAASVSEKGLQTLANAQIDERALAADRKQGVFAQTFVQFSDRMISDYRLKHGKANLEKYAPYFERAEKEYGAPPAVITAFWALETDFGAVQGDFNSLNALTTLAHDCRRPDLFRKQIIPLLTLIDQGVVPADVQGAWAGEIGQTQILPSDYLKNGVDGDGDGIIDLRNSVPDVIMTTAKKIQSRGWRPGEPWMLEVTIPDNLPWDQTGRSNRLPISQWKEWGVTTRDGKPLDIDLPDAGLALPMGHRGASFLMFQNFDVYLEWNQSFTYALTAANLATRFAGAPKLDPRNPVPGLSLDETKQMQEKLKLHGYDVGGVDGIVGVNTRDAVRKEQIRLGLIIDGWPTRQLLDLL